MIYNLVIQTKNKEDALLLQSVANRMGLDSSILQEQSALNANKILSDIGVTINSPSSITLYNEARMSVEEAIDKYNRGKGRIYLIKAVKIFNKKSWGLVQSKDYVLGLV